MMLIECGLEIIRSDLTASYTVDILEANYSFSGRCELPISLPFLGTFFQKKLD